MLPFLFKTLGSELSEEREKDKSFSPVFQALGVEFDRHGMSSRVFSGPEHL